MASLSFSNVAKILLPLLTVAGVYGTWGLSDSNGTFKLLEHIRDIGPQNLPRLNEPLKQDFTGVRAIDHQLTVLTLCFWEVLNGNIPEASLQSFHFVGQVAALWVVYSLEGFRVGNKSRIVSFTTIWGILLQNIAFAVLIPIYLTIHLYTSPTAISSSTRSPNTPAMNLMVHPIELRILPISVFVGLVIPTVLAALPSPSVITHAQHQDFIALWQAFPLWVGSCQLILSMLSSLLLSSEPQSYHSAAERNSTVLPPLRQVYAFAFTLSTVSHVATLTLCIAPMLFPMMFAPAYGSLFHPLHVFFPSNQSPVSSIGEGIFNFLQWDEWVGCTATILWAVALNRNIQTSKYGLLSLVAKTLGLIVVAGPGSAVVALMWERDELVLGGISDLDGKKIN